MRGLSDEIEISIKNALSGMNTPINVKHVDDDKLSRLVASRIESFAGIKEMLISWQNSPNAPDHEKLRSYIIDLIEAGDNSIDVLREALRKNIDFEELDAEKFGTAIKSKPIILKAIYEIDAGNKELSSQIEADKFDLKAREFKRSWPEKFANQEFFPLKNYHKEWHDEATDSILLCPFGTRGETITLDGLNIILPKKPKNTDILYHRKPKEEQYWRREQLPAGLTPDNQDAYTDFIRQEFKRRREGLWFFNNGEAVYITGSHYMALQHIKMLDTGDFMDFRYAQRDMFYFTRACILDRRCLGELFVKSRRTGFTYQIICENINDGTATNNAKLGIISKTGDDAEEAFLKLSYGIQNLPFFFIPVLKGKIDSKSLLEFGKPSDQSKAAKQKKDTSTDDYLNTLFDWKTTTESAYDGQRMFRLLVDEASKPLKPFNLITYLGRVSPTINNGGRIVGKILMGSTVNPMNKGGEEFKKVYKGSIVKKRNPDTQMTPTGLYAFFLPAHKNMEEFTDKYGVCHTHVEPGQSFVNVQGIVKKTGSVHYLEAVRKSKRAQSDILYNEELRANPMTVEEAFRDELTSTLFNMDLLDAQIQYNDDIEIEKTLVRGDFKWRDGVKDSEVIWEPKERGRFLLAWIPPEEMRNKWVMKRNEFGHTSRHPANADMGCMGVDNYDQDSVQGSSLELTENGSEHSEGSKGAMSAVTSFRLDNVPSNFFFLEYITRPQTADIFFEDCLMALVFFGIPALIENNKSRLLYHLYNRGYRGYALHRFDKSMNRLSAEEKKYGGIPNSGPDVITLHWTAIESYIDKYVGVYRQGQDTNKVREEGEIGSMPFNRTLRDWRRFNVAKRTEFDASIASGLALMGVNRKSYVLPEQEKKPIVMKMQRFSNN